MLRHLRKRGPLAEARVEEFVQRYGDLVFDLCESVLWSPTSAQLVFLAIFREIGRAARHENNRYQTYERAWVLRIACDNLRHLSLRHARRVTAAEQIELDASPDPTRRLRRFEVYFHRLGVEEKILLLLRDKYGLPYADISNAIGVPVDSLKARRQHAFRALEDWIWNLG